MAFLRIPRRPNTIEQRMEAVRGFGEVFHHTPPGAGLERSGIAVNFLTGDRLKPVPVFKKRRREISHDDI